MVWGAFTNAGSAMMAMSWDLGTIGQNIANVNTTGYKVKQTLFQTQLSEHLGASAGPGAVGTNIFGVGVVDRNLISNQGVITPTSDGLNMAINGKGFFVVSQPARTGGLPTTVNMTDNTNVLYTRDGNFIQKAGDGGKSYFMTSSGQYLMGWMADSTGTITPGTLTPVYTLPTTTMPANATSTAKVIANIPSQAAMTADPQVKTLSITDANGNAQTLSLSWKRQSASDWTVTGSLDPTKGTVTSTPITVTFDANGNITAPAPTTQNFGITWTAAGGGTSVSSAVNLNAYRPDMSNQSLTLNVYDATSSQHSLGMAFEKVGNDQWYLRFVNNETGGTTSAPVDVTFNPDGTIATPTATTVTATWGNGESSSIALDFSKLTQYGGDKVDVHSITQNGYGEGQLLTTTFTETGVLLGEYDNGQQRQLLQIPVATFVAENNLDPVSGNLFARTQEAGDVTVQAIDQVGVGSGTSALSGSSRFVPGALENSTVDIGSQFTAMILAQKAYSSNASVLKVADEMTTVARDLQT